MKTRKTYKEPHRGLRYERLESRQLLAGDAVSIELVSTGNPDDPAVLVGNGASTRPTISADGRYIAFRGIKAREELPDFLRFRTSPIDSRKIPVTLPVFFSASGFLYEQTQMPRVLIPEEGSRSP